MTSVYLNNFFFWESTPFIQTIQQRLGLAPAPSAQLLQEIEASNFLSFETLLKTVAYLADHSHFQLEQALRNRMAQMEPQQIIIGLQSVSRFALLNDRLKMMDVCQRIMLLRADNIRTMAEREARSIPRPAPTIGRISGSLSQLRRQCPHVLGKIVNCLHSLVIGNLSNIARMLVAPFTNSNSRTVFEWKGYFGIYNSLILTFSSATAAYLGYFSSTRKASIVGILALGGTIGLHYAHKMFNLGIPEKIDPKGCFRNASKEAQCGIIKKMKGRTAERGYVEEKWAEIPGEKFRIALLVGPTGAGKTEFALGLAWESVYDPSSFVYGKTVFIVNTSLAVEQGIYYLRQAFETLKNYENDVVIIFDEGHSAGGRAGTITTYIEFLKTELLEKNIRSMVMTTDEEYKQYLESNKAFVSRCGGQPIQFSTMPDNVTKEIVEDKVEIDEKLIFDVDQNAYPELLFVAANHPDFKDRSNPRKAIDLYRKFRTQVFCWKPKKLREQLALLNDQQETFQKAYTAANTDEEWSDSPAGIEADDQIKDKAADIIALEERLKQQDRDYQKIKRLLALKPHYRKQYNAAVHAIASQKQPNEKANREFLFLKYIVRPVLEATIRSMATDFEITYGETVPLKIDAQWIKNLYQPLYVKAASNQALVPVSNQVVCPSIALSVETGGRHQVHCEISWPDFKQINTKKDEILASSEYGQILKDPTLVFHGVRWDFWKIPSILQHGILSKAAADMKDVSMGFNSRDYQIAFDQSVGCARSPVHERAVGYDAGAFGLHIKDGIAFVAREGLVYSNYKSEISGEARVSWEIETKDIIGLLVSEQHLEKNISDINILEGGSLLTFHLRCQNLLEYLKNEHGIQDRDLWDEVQKSVKTEEERVRLEKRCREVMKLSKKFDIALVGFLDRILPPHMKLYTARGFEIARSAPSA